MLIRHDTDAARRHAFAGLGIRLIEVPRAEAGVDLQAG